ncbi:MAG: hypothetical protein ACRDIF_06880 [Actinomycetota bacterium]
MRRRIELRSPFKVTVYDYRTSWLEVDVDREELVELLLELTLLLYERSERLRMASRSTSNKVVLTARFNAIPGRDLSEVSAGFQSIALMRNDLEFFVAFLLEYYRDGFAPVDHIDIDLRGEDDSDLGLIVTVTDVGPPMRSGETHRILFEEDGRIPEPPLIGRRIELSSPLEVAVYEKRDAWMEVEVPKDELVPLLLELMLLLYERCDTLMLGSRSTSNALVLSAVAGRVGSRVSADLRSISLSRTDLERSIVFLLDYYRDGVAPAHHIDLELGTEHYDHVDLIFRAADFRPPMSEDATRLLRDR